MEEMIREVKQALMDTQAQMLLLQRQENALTNQLIALEQAQKIETERKKAETKVGGLPVPETGESDPNGTADE